MQAFKKLIAPAVAMAALSLAVGAAQADTYNLSLTGGNYSASWQMESSPTVASDAYLDGFLWLVQDVEGNFGGASQAMISFVNGAYFGGIIISRDPTGETYDAYALGQQVYSGTEAAPTLLLGTFALVGSDFSTPYTLTISQAAPVPEPESYALLLAGMGALGFVAARRRKA